MLYIMEQPAVAADCRIRPDAFTRTDSVSSALQCSPVPGLQNALQFGNNDIPHIFGRCAGIDDADAVGLLGGKAPIPLPDLFVEQQFFPLESGFARIAGSGPDFVPCTG